MPKPPIQHAPNLAVEFDRDWDHLPLAELNRLDEICDRFEQALSENRDSRIESFIADLAEPHQRLVVRELVQLEIERRQARGQRPTSDEYALRFPQWADELRTLVAQRLKDHDEQQVFAAATAETVDQRLSFRDTKANLNESPTSQNANWNASAIGLAWTELPTDGVLGHYQLQRVLGRGGMGVVVRAYDTKLGRDVAIKFPDPRIIRDANAKERFLREARAAAAVRHNHAVTIHAVEEINQLPFLVMELVEGTTLDAYLRENGRLSACEVASLAYQTAQELAVAHKRGLIHRDIKPANLLLEKNEKHVRDPRSLPPWHVKITDFGLARVADEAGLTNSGLIVDTPQYMSPEQAEGQSIDARSDLFSLGSVMYAMCAGRPAFDARSAVAIL